MIDLNGPDAGNSVGDPVTAAEPSGESGGEQPQPSGGTPLVRVEVFVDGSNLHPALEESGIDHPVDMGRFATALVSAVGGTELVQLNYVAGVYPEPRSNDPNVTKVPGEYSRRVARKRATDQLYSRLAKEPGVKVWKTRFKYRSPSPSDSRPVVEKGTDVRLALLLYAGARDNRYDVAVLVASDADYYPAVEMVCATGKRVVWAYAPKHRTLREITDAGATALELTPSFMSTCRYVPATPTGGTRGIAARV